jgi:hypothetical protein
MLRLLISVSPEAGGAFMYGLIKESWHKLPIPMAKITNLKSPNPKGEHQGAQVHSDDSQLDCGGPER